MSLGTPPLLVCPGSAAGPRPEGACRPRLLGAPALSPLFQSCALASLAPLCPTVCVGLLCGAGCSCTTRRLSSSSTWRSADNNWGVELNAVSSVAVTGSRFLALSEQHGHAQQRVVQQQ